MARKNNSRESKLDYAIHYSHHILAAKHLHKSSCLTNKRKTVTMKLLTYPAHFRSQKILITAQYANVQIEVDTNVTPESLASKSIQGSVPLLETADGVISESNAIARYIARLNPQSKIYGEKGIFESAQIDSWVDFSSSSLEVPATMWVAPILGWMENKQPVTEQAIKDLKKGLLVLENHLKTRTYIVGRTITLADISIATTLLLPLKLVLDENARSQYPSVIRWFNTCVHQPEFSAVIGEVTLCKTPLVAAASSAAASAGKKDDKKPKEEKKAQAPKEEKKPKEEAKRKEPEPKAAKEGNDEEEIDEALVEKKAKNPLDSLPKSSFSLDGWKREYSNAPGGDCYSVMPYLWQNFDAAGFSIFIQRYKYNEELTVSYKTSNLVGGFIQRAEEMRKYAFGVMQILGQEGGPMEIVGAWIMRGDSIQAMAESNPDTDSYAWEKITDLNDANKQKIADLFCSWETIEGKPIMDCKVFK